MTTAQSETTGKKTVNAYIATETDGVGKTTIVAVYYDVDKLDEGTQYADEDAVASAPTALTIGAATTSSLLSEDVDGLKKATVEASGFVDSSKDSVKLTVTKAKDTTVKYAVMKAGTNKYGAEQTYSSAVDNIDIADQAGIAKIKVTVSQNGGYADKVYEIAITVKA